MITSFREEIRYEYPLSNESVVLDLGCYEGQFSRTIYQRYGCRIDAFEPLKRFYDQCVANLTGLPVRVHHCGVGAKTRVERFSVHGSMTGIYGGTSEVEQVSIVSIDDVLPPTPVDLLKINIEGMEYELLEHILATGLATRFRNIQVQFHALLPEHGPRYIAIRNGLLATHHLTYDFPFCWENYAINQ